MVVRSRFFVPASLFLLAACGGGGGGDSSGPSTLSGELTLPVTARVANPAAMQMATLPMVAGEVVVWLDDANAPPDLSARGLDLLRHGGGNPRGFLRGEAGHRCAEGIDAFAHLHHLGAGDDRARLLLLQGIGFGP